MPHTVPTQRRMRAAIRREFAAAAQTDAIASADWYVCHRSAIAAWAEDRGIGEDRAIAAAATISPGLDPATETACLSWVAAAIAAGEEPNAENRPHGTMIPYGYGAFRRAGQCLLGTRGMPAENVKTGNYARAIADPNSREWVAIDVWAWRTTCGDPLDSTRPLPSFLAGEYAEVRRAWQAVADELDMTPSALQAVCWVYRRGRA